MSLGLLFRIPEFLAYDDAASSRSRKKKRDLEPVVEEIDNPLETVAVDEPETVERALEADQTGTNRLFVELRALLIDVSTRTYADFTKQDTKEAVRKARKQARARQQAIQSAKQRQSEAVNAMVRELTAQMDAQRAAEEAEMLEMLMMVHEYDF